MASGPLQPLLRQLHRMLGSQGAGALPDVQLLERFLQKRDEAAFEVLLWRHGPMVWNVCQRVLHRHADAEDAFQATFLMLIRKDRSIRKRQALGSWLYKVAYRIALAARSGATRRASTEQQRVGPAAADGHSPSEEAGRRELRSTLDEAVASLPEKYRTPLVLCYFEGMTYAEAAQELACPKGTLSIRLTRARELLRPRLARRGVIVSLPALTATLAPDTASAAVSSQLVKSALTATLWFVARKAAPVGILSEQAIRLVEGVSRAMFFTRLRLIAGVVLAVLVPGVALWSYGAPADEERRETPIRTQAAPAALRPAQSKSNRSADKPEAGLAQSAIPVFIRALKDPDRDIRATAAKALMRLGAAAAPALVDVLEGKDQKLIVAALHAIAGMQAQGSFDGGAGRTPIPTMLRQALENALANKGILVQLLRTEDVALSFGRPDIVPDPLARPEYALVNSILGAKAVPSLIEFLKRDDQQLRIESIRLLRLMGEAGTDALPALTEMFNRTSELEERRVLLDAISNIAAPEGRLRVPGIRGPAGGKGKGGKGKGGKTKREG